MSLNNKDYRFNRSEISGALGDLGTLIPLSLSLITMNGLNPTSVFLSVGLLYIFAGLYFGIPMPVQPLKAVAAIPIASSLSPNVISAAAFLMGTILLLLSVTRAVNILVKVFSVPVIKGIQLSIGFLLMKSGLELMAKGEFLIHGPDMSIWSLPMGILVGPVSLLLIMVFLRFPMVPTSLLVLSFGILMGVFLGPPSFSGSPSLGPVLPSLSWPSAKDFLLAFVLLVIPQLPLTLGNAVISTTDVAREYFGSRAQRVTPKRLCYSMGLVNIWVGLTGGMPLCHGAGGMTAHYRFGARTPGANLFIGGFCLLLSLAFGQASTLVLSIIPYSVLGALLFYVGWRHVLLIARVRRRLDYATVFTVAGATLIFRNLAIACGIGIAVDWLLNLQGVPSPQPSPPRGEREGER